MIPLIPLGKDPSNVKGEFLYRGYSPSGISGISGISKENDESTRRG